MSRVVDLHPSLTAARVVEIGGEDFVNVSGVIQMAREGGTPQCRSLVRFYGAEYRALEGQPLTAGAREWEAFKAAWKRMERKFGVPPIGPERPAP